MHVAVWVHNKLLLNLGFQTTRVPAQSLGMVRVILERNVRKKKGIWVGCVLPDLESAAFVSIVYVIESIVGMKL